MRDLYSIGEMVIDFIPGSEPASYIRKAGGAPANVAIAVTKNGLRSAMCCKVGEDDFGRFLMDTLAEYDVEAVCPDLCREATTTMAFVTLAENKPILPIPLLSTPVPVRCLPSRKLRQLLRRCIWVMNTESWWASM